MSEPTDDEKVDEYMRRSFPGYVPPTAEPRHAAAEHPPAAPDLHAGPRAPGDESAEVDEYVRVHFPSMRG